MSSTETSERRTQTSAESLIRYVEVWCPNDDATRLVLSAARTVAPETGANSQSRMNEVRSGEGVAGAAWNQKAATVFQEEPSDLLQKISESSGTDLAAVVALPLFRNQEIRGVVVLGLGHGYGAAEVWSRDDRDELNVTSGHYSGLPAFEFITRYTRFPKGAGVPGNVWKTGQAQINQNLDTSASFIRSFGNDPATISSAIGLPVASSRGFPSSILLLLSAGETPLAPHTELWKCGAQTVENEVEADSLQITSTVTIGALETADVQDWQRRVIAQVAASAGPCLVDICSEDQLPSGGTCVLAVPIFKAAQISSVLSLTF